MALGRVGLQSTISGSDPGPSFSNQGEQIINPLLPDLALASGAGQLLIGCQAAAGVAPGTSPTTTTPAFTVWYGANTNFQIYIVDYWAAYVSGTIGAGHVMFGMVASAAAPTGGTAITAYTTNSISSSTSVSMGTGHTTTAMSATTDRFPVMDLAATLATAPAAGVGSPFNFVRAPVGVWLPPGIAGCFYGVAAGGSTPLIRAAVRVMVRPTTALPS